MFENEGQRDEFLTMAKVLAETATEGLHPTFFADLDGSPDELAALIGTNPYILISKMFGVSVFCVPFSGPEDKEAFRTFLGNLISHDRISWFGLIFESWMCKAVSEEEYNKVMAMPAKDRPGATEVIFVNIGSPKVELQYIAELHRVRGKRVVGKWQLMQGDTLISGRFAHVWKNSVAVNN